MVNAVLKQKFVEKINNQLNEREKRDELLQQFVHLFFERVHHPSFQKYSTDELVAYVDFVWLLFQTRARLESQFAIQLIADKNQQGNEWLIALVNTDRPYIIDSLQAFLSKWKITPKLLIHPVMNVKRDADGKVRGIFSQRQVVAEHIDAAPESTILLRITKNFKPDELELFKQQLQQMLKRLTLAIDHQPKIDKILTNFDKHVQHNFEGEEALSFLKWLHNKQFLFLGARYFKAENNHLNTQSVQNSGLFADQEISTAKDLLPTFLVNKESSSFVCVTKTNLRSPIIRPSRLDVIEVLDCGGEGEVQGVYQFIGLFSKEIFTTSAFDIPYLAGKAQRVFNHFGVDASWYDGKVLISVLDSIPRDEMFYHTEEQLIAICERVLDLLENEDVAVFSRPDASGHYLTVMVYLPRERYSYELKNAMGKIIAESCHGEISSNVSQVGDLPFARVIYVLTLQSKKTPAIDFKKLEQQLHLISLAWSEALLNYALQSMDESEATHLLSNYEDGFPGDYQENFTVEQVFADIQQIESLTPQIPICLSLTALAEGTLLAKIYHQGEALPLSQLLPILANLGFNVLSESTYTIMRQHQPIRLYQFTLALDPHISWEKNTIYLETAFQQIWQGVAENDGFNQLIIKAGLTVRQVCLLRAVAKYLMQVKFSYSLGYLESTLSAYPELATLLVEFFEAKFQPHRQGIREPKIVEDLINNQLQNVVRLDHDRILRRILNTISAMLRTNYYQVDASGFYKEYISFKFNCEMLEDLPSPRPLYEVYVYSPRLEAIHLRGGKVARGGIRWSDRFEDYRSEVLGLMKAQMVKNSVIVPSGSKGGFIVKQQANFTDRQELMQEVISCYQTMIRGLLDVTDNLVEGRVVSPQHVIRYDQDDPYLVVAADKGTATFSDIANAISQEYNFWLDDAFASGGSAGYDHKKMAITSRGAWEAVKRHFREAGIDSNLPFSVVGVGDMSGDVFGNGMLRSDKIQLLAAFDHRHIFIDPTPDPARSFQERQRLFELPRSSWQDYDPALISTGGGVYSRSDKFIVLSQEAQSLLHLNDPKISPDKLVQQILQMPVDLLWFGGIGTFVKSSAESHADAGDVGNQPVRINANQIQAQVVVEGANLGLTQSARIEYALTKGRINTDAIDNSAGVDCSDHEVNIKILFNSLSQSLSRSERDKVLKTMTDEVAHLVLEDNYRQTQILSVLEVQGVQGLSIYQNLIKVLEGEGNLNRALECLPDDELIEQRRAKGQGLTRPELAVLLAYAKNSLYNTLMNSLVVKTALYQQRLLAYFPKHIQDNFTADVIKHPLQREIIITCLTNDIINRVGPAFVYEVSNATGKSSAEVVAAYFTAVEILDLNSLWAEVDALDALMLPKVQIEAYLSLMSVLKLVVIKLLSTANSIISKPIITTLLTHLASHLVGEQSQLIQSQRDYYEALRIPHALYNKLILIPYMGATIDIALTAKLPAESLTIATAYYKLRSVLGFDWLAQYLQQLDSENDWQRGAQLGFQQDISQILIGITSQATENFDVVEGWIEANSVQMHQALECVRMLKGAIRPDFGLLSYVIKQLQRIFS